MSQESKVYKHFNDFGVPMANVGVRRPDPETLVLFREGGPYTEGVVRIDRDGFRIQPHVRSSKHVDLHEAISDTCEALIRTWKNESKAYRAREELAKQMKYFWETLP